MPANKKLEFLFKIIDRVSAPSNKMAQSIRKLELAMGDARKEANRLGSSFAKINLVGRGADRAGRALRGAKKEASGWSSTLQGIQAGIGILSTVAGAARGFGSIIANNVIGVGQLGVALDNLSLVGLQKFALEAASFKESTLIGLEVTLGSRDAAKDIFRDAVKFAAETPFETKDVLKLTQDLLTAGFSAKKNMFGSSEISVLSKGIGDMASARGMDSTVIHGLVKALGDIRSRGSLAGQELNQLANYGVAKTRIFDQLAKSLGKTNKEITAMQEAGKISSSDAEIAIANEMKRMSGGMMGGLMKKQSASFSGLWSTIKSRPFEMLMDLDESEGFKQAKGFLSNLGTALNPSSGPGMRLKKKAETLMSDLMGFTFSGLSDDKGAERIGMFLENVLDTVGKVGGAVGGLVKTGFTALGDKLKELGGGDIGKGVEVMFVKIGDFAVGLVGKLEKLATKAGVLIDLIVGAQDILNGVGHGIDVDRIEKGKKLGLDVSAFEQEEKNINNGIINIDTDYQRDLGAKRMELDREIKILEDMQKDPAYQAGVTIGENIAKGYRDGIFKDKTLADAPRLMVQLGIKGVVEELDSHSPSRVFEYFGLMTAKGYEKGVGSGQGAAEDKVRELMSARGAAFDTNNTNAAISPSISSAAPSGRGLSIGSLSVVVQAGAQSDPQATAAAVAEILPEALLEALERINMETGNQ